MKLESFNIKFEYIQGSKNVLVDTLSRLIDINEDTWLTPEEQGYEFSYAVFEDLPKIEGFHRFLKACITKHINQGLEWDKLTPMATACYNYFPNYSARESAFVLMFGRDPFNKLNQMLHEARRYFHDDNGIPDLEALKNIYQVVAQQLLNSKECYMKKHHNQKPVESPVKLEDLILMANHTAKAFKPKYKKGTYRVVKVHGNIQCSSSFSNQTLSWCQISGKISLRFYSDPNSHSIQEAYQEDFKYSDFFRDH